MTSSRSYFLTCTPINRLSVRIALGEIDLTKKLSASTGTNKTKISPLPPAPFSVHLLLVRSINISHSRGNADNLLAQRYVVILHRFELLFGSGESSACGLDQFLVAAEYRYALYLDLLARSPDTEIAILPPWYVRLAPDNKVVKARDNNETHRSRDVAIIWHAHLTKPLPYLQDVIYRPAYSGLWEKDLDFPVDDLARLVEQEIWSDPTSASAWKTAYPESEYQIWNSLPSNENETSPLNVDAAVITCSHTICTLEVPVLIRELLRLRAKEQSVECSHCGTWFGKDEICFANLRRDWQTLLGADGEKSQRAIKGAIFNAQNGFYFSVQTTADWIRD